jgi:hypothetical protein
MSDNELNKTIKTRRLDADCPLLRRHCAVLRRELDGPGVMARRIAAVPQRRLAGPIHFLGHSFAALEPVLVSGPTSVGHLDHGHVYWTTDVPAYHRVAFRKGIGGTPVVTGWSGPSTSADVLCSPCDPERVSYYYDIQSCIVGDGSAAFAWYPVDDSLYWTTTCSGTFGMANWNASKQGFGKLEFLTLEWTTSIVMLRAQINSTTAGLIYGPWLSGGTAHTHDYVPFDFSRTGTYYWRTRNQNKCGIYCGYSAYHSFTVGSSGTIVAQT